MKWKTTLKLNQKLQRKTSVQNSNACAPINTVSRSGTQSTHILERITDKTAGKRPAGAAGTAAPAAGATGATGAAGAAGGAA